MIKKLFLCVCALLLSNSILMAQKTVTGIVSDATGPLPSVSVQEKGTTNGVETDFDGNFSIKVSNDQAVLVFRFLGYKTKELSISGLTTLNVTLEEDSENLEEVVVTAQGIKKSKKALGYAITKLDGKDIGKRPEADAARSLQGKIAGVTIGAANGQTGSSSPIRIRGSISLTGSNSPLIVVNNVPFNGLLRDIDPNDIETMSVLKGFNAAVLYGSEGRNGVILIQTKSGNAALGEAKTTASFSTTSYVNSVSQLPEFQNTYGQGQEGNFIPTFLSVWGPSFSSLNEVAHPYAALSNVFPQYAGKMVPYEAKPNNVRNIFRTGIGTIHSLSVSTSKEKVAFNLSAGYTKETGIIANNDLKRFNIGIGGNAQITDKFNLAATLNFSTRKTNRIQSQEVFRRTFYLPRNIDLTELPYQNPLTGASVYYRNDTNPLWVLNNSGVRDDVARVFGTVNANYQFNDNFGVSYRVGYDNEQRDNFDFSNKGGFGGSRNIDVAFQNGYLNLDYIRETVVDQTIIFNYNRNLTEDLTLEAQVGANSKITKGRRISSDSQGQFDYGFLRPDNFGTTQSNYASSDENIAGIFGQFQFSYKNYLYATLSGRNDWGSTVERDNISLFYPGAAISFIPTSAFDFGEDSFVRYLKLRGAYATSSGYPEAYNTRDILIIDANRFATRDGILPVTNRFGRRLGNPNLKPELHKEIEFGIESKLFKNRVTFEASFYKRISEDQIVEAPLAVETGYDFQVINLGRIDNKGIEIDLGIDVVKNDDFSWNIRNIFTADESLVVKTTASGAPINLISDRWAVEGQPLNAIIGDYALRDANGNLLISGNGSSSKVGEVIASSDIGLENKVIGDPNPDWRFTNINTISYKGFTFSAQLEYRHGGDISSRSVEDMLERGVTRDTENREGSFVIPGFLADDDTGQPLLDANGNQIPNTIQLNGLRTVFSNYYNANDLSMWDASVFRIREVSLNYSIKKKQGQKLPFNTLDFTISGRNLWYKAPNFPKYINYDPENDNGLGRNTVPSTKRISLGISATF